MALCRRVKWLSNSAQVALILRAGGSKPPRFPKHIDVRIDLRISIHYGSHGHQHIAVGSHSGGFFFIVVLVRLVKQFYGCLQVELTILTNLT